MLLAPVQIARAESYSVFPSPKNKTFTIIIIIISFLYILVYTNKYVCVWLFVIALGCFIGDVYTRREADV